MNKLLEIEQKTAALLNKFTGSRCHLKHDSRIIRRVTALGKDRMRELAKQDVDKAVTALEGSVMDATSYEAHN